MLPQGGTGTMLFYAAAFLMVALLFFVGPRRGKPGSVWFGISCLFLSAYAVLSLGLRLPTAHLVTASGAAVCFVIGLWAASRDKKARR